MVERPKVLDILRFVIELVAFGSLAYWGFASFDLPWNFVAGIGAPLVAILVWALFLSPRAVLAVHPFVQAFAELLIYVAVTAAWFGAVPSVLIGGAAWWSLGHVWIGIGFAVIAVAVGVIVGRRKFA